ncbi:Pilin/Flagellin, FlaG/FlaF family [Halapricum desulfuricans]|uniref:Pilin/Flagellin, FlaG/FlaF family n=1 Tax=Halapricum desulfuricans TaxID=2841257 RepID=A0A897NM21_9EURY|nr:type IV pilin [Halapricum desulfuricans]QSG11919.1 Pilin/Flagellin, FlaG/FlaF family [Halapricum desulfuricans]
MTPRTKQSSCRYSAQRAQSEVVGVVILVGVFAVLAVTVGTVVIGNVTEQAGDEPLVDLNASATTDSLTLVHGGGDSLEAADVDVIVRNTSEERRLDLEVFDETQGNDDDRFTAGEKRRYETPFDSGTLRVLVVHEPSNAVIHDETIEIS